MHYKVILEKLYIETSNIDFISLYIYNLIKLYIILLKIKKIKFLQYKNTNIFCK